MFIYKPKLDGNGSPLPVDCSVCGKTFWPDEEHAGMCSPCEVRAVNAAYRNEEREATKPDFYVVFFMGDDYYAQWMLDIVAATKEAAELYVAYAVLAGRRLDQFEIVDGTFNETTDTWISPDEYRQ